MDRQIANDHKLRNIVHTLLLMLGMALLLALSAELLLGAGVWPWVFVGVALLMLVMPEISPRWVLSLYQARPLQPAQAPRLSELLREISRRAGLRQAPELYWVPSHSINAFSVGHRAEAAVAVTQGLLERLSFRELAGVLAHEVSHVANNDMRLLGLADMISRLTHVLSITGVLLALLSLPLLLLGYASVSLPGLLLLILAPNISALLQLALSRIREFDADLGAARITGDPAGLASALDKIEQQRSGFWQRILLPGYRDTGPSLLRTHPDTSERIRRLLELREKAHPPMDIAHRTPLVLPGHYRILGLSPRQRILRGIWY